MFCSAAKHPLKNATDCYYDVTKNYASMEVKYDADGNEYYEVTYTITATDSIVSLTNIKVTGYYQFTIIDQDDVDVNGPEGEDSTEDGGEQ